MFPRGALARSPAAVRRRDFDFDRLFHGLLDVQGSSRAAAADLYETEEGYRLELDVPGFTEAEIDVTVDCGVLTISGVPLEEERDRTYHVRERRRERFTRGFALPASIRGSDVAAKLDAGVLTVELPRSPEAKPNRIPIWRAK